MAYDRKFEHIIFKTMFFYITIIWKYVNNRQLLYTYDMVTPILVTLYIIIFILS